MGLEVVGDAFFAICFAKARSEMNLHVRACLVKTQNYSLAISQEFIRFPRFTGTYNLDRKLTRRPLGLRATRQPLGGGHIVAPFISATISSQHAEIEKRNFAHIFLNT